MPSLRQLRAEFASMLLIDAASSRIQVGWLTSSGDRWQICDDEAGVGVFAAIESLQIDLAKVDAFIFCEGPGSILGIRTVSMAVRTWNVFSPRPVFAYQGLALVAHALGREDVTVIADARRDSWHTFRAGGKLERVPASDLTGTLVTPDGFRNWSALPIGVTPVSYVVADLLSNTAGQNLFRTTESPDAFLHQEPSYVTWSPQIHRAAP
jgi:tRNA threonylcarbamoyladenosine biosynthesis protein TsaB